MTTSGTATYTLIGSQIINLAFELIGVGTQGETLSAEEIAAGMQRLNLLAKSWQAERIYLFKKRDAVLFMVPGQERYALGPGGDRALVSWAETTVTVDALAGSNTLTVGSISGMSSGQTIGILQDSGAMQWTTINGAPAGSSVVITDALTGLASSGKKVFAYSAIMGRPLKVLDLQRRSPDNVDIEMTTLSRSDYRNLPNKFIRSLPVQYYYDPQMTTGYLYVWPAPSDSSYTVRFTAAMPFEDFASLTDGADFPQEWIEALAYGLAQRLIPTYGDALPTWQVDYISSMAADLKNTVKGWDEDEAPIRFEPAPHYGR